MSGVSDTSELAAEPRGERPPRLLQRRLVFWSVTLVVTPTFVCAVWLNDIARDTLSATNVRTVDLLAQTVSASLSGRLTGKDSGVGWSAGAQAVIDGLVLDPRVAFVIVADRENEPLYQGPIDPEAWVGFMQRADEVSGSSIEPVAPIRLASGDELVVRKVPIWKVPVKGMQPPRVAGRGRQLEGFVLLGMRDKIMSQMQHRLMLVQIGAACLVCLMALPVVLWAVQRLTAPLRSLLRATGELTSGRKPTPVPEGANDELGLLARRFNHMSGRLLANRREIEQANEKLEVKVLQRTEELEQLNQRLACEIREKDEFLRAVSHDLGTPMRNISGMARSLLTKYRQDLADDALRKLERITANARLQAELINELLELSKIRTRPARNQTVDLNLLVHELTGNLEYDLQRRGVELQIEDPLPIIHADHNRMRQVFQNLLDNAVKYMLDSRARCITVNCDTEGDAFTFSVADTGRGIAEQDLPLIFQVFRRAEHSGASEVSGRGVGLASVKSIIETYGGAIWVNSELGKGSTFFFTLPKARVALPLEQEPHRAGSSIEAAGRQP